MKELIIKANDAEQRLDKFLKKYLCNAPLSMIYKTIRKDAKLNGRRVKEDTVIHEGDVLSLYVMDEELEALSKKKTVRAKKQFTVIYEDDNILAVDKPYGLLVHGDAVEKKDTLANQVIDYLIEKGDYVPRLEKSFTPSPAHRLDRNTTGIVLFGKSAEGLRSLTAALADRSGDEESGCGIHKIYTTVCFGKLDKEMHLRNKLIKDERANKGRVLPLSSPEGKYIETIARPVAYSDGLSLVEVELVTGRSHQIRAHMAFAGYPLLGDVKYCKASQTKISKEQYGVSTQLLHAGKLRFVKVGGAISYMNGREISAPLPQNFNTIVKNIFK